MKKKTFVLWFAVLLTVLGISGCSSTDDITQSTIYPQTEETTVSTNVEITRTETPIPVTTEKPTMRAAEPEINSASDLEVHFIDVGQADAILLFSDGHYMLIDGGNAADSNLIYSYLDKLGITYLDYIIGTHAHEDHFYPADFGIYGDCYAHNMTSEKLEIYCNSRVKEMFDAVSREIAIPDSIKNNLLFTVVSAFEEFSLGDRYRVTPLKANHSPNENALFYLIREGEKQLLYAHDTGHFPEETTDYLANNLVRPVDMLSLDATLGKNHCYDGHMGFYECFDMLDILKQRGIVDDNTVVVFNHFSHNGMLLHDEASELAAAHGALVSYDGMQVEL